MTQPSLDCDKPQPTIGTLAGVCLHRSWLVPQNTPDSPVPPGFHTSRLPTDTAYRKSYRATYAHPDKPIGF